MEILPVQIKHIKGLKLAFLQHNAEVTKRVNGNGPLRVGHYISGCACMD